MFCSSLGFSPSSIFGSLIAKSLISLTATSMDDHCLNNFAIANVLLGEKNLSVKRKSHSIRTMVMQQEKNAD